MRKDHNTVRNCETTRLIDLVGQNVATHTGDPRNDDPHEDPVLFSFPGVATYVTTSLLLISGTNELQLVCPSSTTGSRIKPRLYNVLIAQAQLSQEM